jgi:hypothetical protein
MLNMLSRRPEPSADFDFFIGIWKCRHRYLVRRLAGCHDWIEFDGTCATRKVLAGFGHVEESDIGFSGGRYHGMALRIYDTTRGRWTIHWFDSRDPGRTFPPLSGQFAGGIGTFHGEDEHEGRPVRVRFLWSRITPTSARWEQAFSADSGASWETNWFMDFTRV